ncbi:hypothetical protein ABT025_13960 [Streptomyces sp. NPDC002809]|uniref:hypothetical protein n=1 Tax=Streptomyces sp. NPDC002809 TaxID=3154433 RepID=UPI003328524A
MSTPPLPGNLQTSSQAENQKGYQALDQAKRGVQRAQEDVKTTMQGLISAYGGQDGGAFQRLLADWSQQVDLITKNVGDMMQKLEETGVQQRSLQTQTTDTITSAGKSNSVFDTLTGK